LHGYQGNKPRERLAHSPITDIGQQRSQDGAQISATPGREPPVGSGRLDGLRKTLLGPR
jgi:hypothetical protein